MDEIAQISFSVGYKAWMCVEMPGKDFPYYLEQFDVFQPEKVGRVFESVTLDSCPS